MKNRLYAIREVADILGVSTKTLRRWDQRGRFVPTRTAGNQRRYTQEQILNLKSQISKPRNSVRIEAKVSQGEPFFKPQTPKEFKPTLGLPSILNGLPSNSFLKHHFLLKHKTTFSLHERGKDKVESEKSFEASSEAPSPAMAGLNPFKIGFVVASLVLILSLAGSFVLTKYNVVAGLAQKKEQFVKFIANLPQISISIKPKDLGFVPQDDQAVLAATIGDSDLILNINVPSFFSQSVGIGTTTIDPSAIFDLTSEDKGFLAPRMTEAQLEAIPTPAAGLFVYNTDTNHYNMYNGTAWQGVFTSIGDSTAGDAFTETGTNGKALWFNGTSGGRVKVTAGSISGAKDILTLPDTTGTFITTGNLTAINTVGTISTGVWNGTVLTVPYGGTGVSTLTGIVLGNGSGVMTGLTTSAGIAGAIGDETGTGLMVFGTSPAITTSITTASTTFALINTAATTVNFAGAATTLSIGAATGTVTLNNATTAIIGALTANGNITLGDAITDTITFTGRVAQDSDLIPIGTTGTNDLGSSSLPWDNVYADNVFAATSGFSGYFQRNSQALSPTNITDDLLLGATSTSSAKFGFLNIAGGNPTATISSNLSLVVPTGNGPSARLNLLNNGSLNIQRSIGGDAGLTSALFIQNDGNVGIGMTAPTTPLEVQGTIYATSPGGAGTTPLGSRLALGSPGGSPGLVIAEGDGAGGTLRRWDVFVNSQKFYISDNTGGATRLMIDTSGNVGIGNTTPLTALDVTGSASLSANISLRGSGTAHTFNILDNGTLNFQRYPSGDAANNSSVLFLQNNGNVGIGTTAPATLFDVNSLFNVASGGNVGIGTVTPTSFKLEVGGNVGPTVGSTYDLGSSSRRWNNVYGVTANFTNLSTSLATISGTTTQDFLINSDNVTADLEDASLSFSRGTGTNSQFKWNSTTKQLSTNSPSFAILPDATIAYSGTAALMVNQVQAQDIFTASASGTTRFTINNSGNVGIGISNPLTALDVVGSASLSANLSLKGAGTAHTFNILDNGSLNVQKSIGGDAGLATALYIRNNGNVGIGTTAPSTSLYVYKGSAAGVSPMVDAVMTIEHSTSAAINFLTPDESDQLIAFGDTLNNDSGELRYRHRSAGDDMLLRIGGSNRLQYSAGAFAFQEATTISTPVNTTLTLSNSGTGNIILSPGSNVGIGNTTPLTALDVTGSASLSANLSLRGAGTAHTFNILDNGTLNFQRYPGGDAANNSSVLFLQNNGNVGIGTTTPENFLHVVAPSGDLNAFVGLDTYSTAGATAGIYGRRARGTLGSPSALQSGDLILQITAAGYGATGFGTNKASIRMWTAETWTDAAQGTYIAFETTTAGTTTRDERWRITDAGIWQSNGAQTIQTSTGNLTLATLAGNGNILLSPNGTGKVGIGNTTPLTALDVTGSASLSANLSLRGAGTAHTFNILDNGTLNFQRYPGGDAANNSSVLFLQNNGNVGIGTTAPTDILHLSATMTGAGSDPNTFIALDTYSTNGATPGILARRARGTMGSPSAIQANDLILQIMGQGYGTTGFGSQERVRITFNAAEYWSDSVQGTYMTFETTAIGGTTRAERWRITDTGVWQSNGAQTIQTSTGNLTLATAGGNGNILLSPNGTGKVGIGTTSPLAALDVRGSLGTIPAASISATSSFASLIVDNSGVGDLFTASKSGATKFVITNAGGVGVGTTSLSAIPGGEAVKMHISGSLSGSNIGALIENTDSAAGSLAALNLKTGASTNYWQWFARNGDLFAGVANVADYMVIKSGGNVGIGNTTPLTALDVTGSASLSANISLRGAGTAHTFNILDNGSLNFRKSIGGDVSMTNVLYLENSGNVGIGNTAPAAMLSVGSSTPALISSAGLITVANTTDSTSGSTGSINTLGGLGVTKDLAVDGGDIVTAATTFNLLNTTATTLNFAGAATTLSIGAATGTVTLNNATTAITGALTANGDVTLGNAITDNITFTGRVAADSDLLPIGTTGTNDLGSSALPWDNLYVDNIYSPSVGTAGYWQRNGQALSPTNITDDLLLGATSTSSAKFGFINVAGGTPTASISANSGNNATTLTGLGVLGTTNMQTLTLGNSTTGNIVIDSGSSVINVPDLTASRALFTDASSNLTSSALSAALLNSLTDETGTGALVFANTPTLVTPVLGAATYTTLSGGNITDSGLTAGRVTFAGTAGILSDDADLTFATDTLTVTKMGATTLTGTIAGGGNQLNNIIIGATTPLAGTFTTLQANTGITPDADDGAYLGQSGTGFSDLFLASGAVINFAAGDVTLTHASNVLGIEGGNVGIGNTSPLTALDVTGSASLSANISLRGSGTAHLVKILDNGSLNFVTSVGGDAVTNSTLFIGNGTAAGSGSVGIGDTTPDALLDLDSADTDGGDFLITNTGVGLSGTVAGITSNSTTTGDILTLSGTSLSTGSLLILTGPSGGTAGVTDAQLKIASDVGNIGTSNGLISSTATFDGTTATGVNLYLSSTDAVVAGNTDYGIYNVVSNTGAITTQTKNVYGEYTSVTGTGGTTTTPTTNVYGSYLTTTASHATDVGTVNQYGLYIANGTSSTNGTSTKYGLYVESPTGADANYAAYLGGNVGIGIAVPGSRLEISTASTNYQSIRFAVTAGAASKIFTNFAGSETEKALILGTYSNSANQLVLDTTGNVGIGNTTPLTALDVTGSASLSANLSFRNAATNLYYLDNGNLNIQRSPKGDAGALSVLYLGNSGNVGIGTTSPAYDLDVQKAGGTSNVSLRAYNTSNTAIAAHAIVEASVGGTTSTGDPQLRLTIPDGTSWYAGVDNSDSDIFKIGTGTSVGASGTFLYITSTGNFSINSTPATSRTLFLGKDYTNTGASNVGLYAELDLTENASGSNNSGAGSAVLGLTQFRAGNTKNWTNTVGARGVDALIDLASTTNVYTITGAAGLHVRNATNLGSGIITNQYGLYIETLTSGTNNYGIYVNTPTGTTAEAIHVVGGTSYFGGNVGIGNTTPLTALDVTGSASLSANLSLRGAGTAHTFNILDNGTLNFQRYPSGDAANNSSVLFLQNNGNVGIGTTDPQRPLHVSGIARIQESGDTTNYGEIQASGDVLYIDSYGTAANSGDIRFRTNDITVTAMTILANGNVGIGTTAPGNLLVVQGADTALEVQNTTDAVSNQVAIFHGGNRATPANNDELYLSYMLDDADGAQQEFGRQTIIASRVATNNKRALFQYESYSANTFSEFLRFGDAGDGPIFTINEDGLAMDTRIEWDSGDAFFVKGSTGNVGIGNTAPLTALDVTGSASLSANLSLRGAGTAHTFNILDNGTLNFQRWPSGDAANNSSVLFLQNNGNVGIGTTAPLTTLYVKNTDTNANAAQLTLEGQYGDNLAFAGVRFKMGVHTTGWGADIQAVDQDPWVNDLIFRTTTGGSATTTPTEKMRITGAGLVGIGATTPDTTLHVVKGSGGTITPNLNTVLTVENSTSAWITIATPDTSAEGGILFANDVNGEAAAKFGYEPGASDRFEWAIGGSDRLFYSVNAFAFQESTTLSTPINTNLTLSNSGTGNIILSPGVGVGIGNTTPLTALDVTGSASLSANLSFRAAATNLYYLDNGNLNIQRSPKGDAGATSVLYLSNNGNIGIGTTAPAGLLTLANNGWFSGVSTQSGQTTNMFKLNTADQIQVGASLNIDGSFNFPTDAGYVTAMDLPMLSAGNGTTSGYVFRMGSSNIMTIYGENSSGTLANGRVGIGTTAPLLRLDVQDSQDATAAAQIFNTSTNAGADGLVIKLGNTSTTAVASTNHFISFETAGIGIVGSVQGSGGKGVTYATSGIADFAEYFKKDQNSSIPFGSVVCFDSNGLAVACDNNSNKIIGVASERPAFLGGENLGNKSIAVGLVGQVRTRVSTANGAIKIGDPLTTSGTAGIAVKATTTGQILGKAIEAYDPSAGSGQVEGNILVSVNIGWYNPSIYVSYDGTLAGMATTVASIGDQLTLQGQNLALQGEALQAQTASNAAAVASVSASLAARTNYILENDPLFRDSQDKVSALESKLDLLSLQMEQQASISAFLAGIQSGVLGASTSAALNATLGDVELNNATITDNLMVLGRTTVSDLGVTGNINAGLLAIHGIDGEINTLSGDLYLQKDGLGGVNILAGKVVIDASGNMIVAGTITADTVEASNYTVLGGESIGSATIPAGSTSIEVATAIASESSKIFLTSTSLTDKQITVVQKSNGKFKVAIPSPTTSPITFDWWIVGNKQ